MTTYKFHHLLSSSLPLSQHPHQIQGWTHRANMCGFTLVAAPMLQSLSPSGLGSSAHPFRRPLFIPLRLPPSIPNQQLPQFELITRVLSEIINR